MQRLFNFAPLILHHFQLQNIFQLVGCKTEDALKLADSLFTSLGGSDPDIPVKSLRVKLIESACILLELCVSNYFFMF